MSSMSKNKYQPLTAQEAEWIDGDRDAIEGANCSISGLARILTVLAEMVDDDNVDPYYKEELCRKGVMSIAYSIDELTNMISDRHEHIKETLEGTTTVVLQTRLERFKKRYLSIQEGEPHEPLDLR